jgi:hypothetical protein
MQLNSSATPTANQPQFYSQTNPINNLNKPKFPWSIVLGVLVALLIVGTALVVYFKSSGAPILSPFGNLTKSIKDNIASAKDVMNPLTGVMYTKDESAAWSNERPLGVMVNNHVEARPQSGLNQADIVYEIVAEGGITRFLAFYLTNQPAKVGPIRSIREYYLEVVKEVGDAMIMHIGYSPQALEAIETWPVRSLIRLGLNCDNVLPDPTDQDCWRNKARVDADVAWEHTAYGNVALLRKAGVDAGWEGKPDDFKSWSFKDDANKYAQMPAALDISVDFWTKGDYSAAFKYNSTNNTYLRYESLDAQGQPVPQIDLESNKQLEVNNVVVQFAVETAVAGDEKGRLEYQLTGSGEGLIFVDGKVIKATWSKASRGGRTMYYDTNGQEIAFNRGKFWISIVPSRNADQVVYK